MRLGPFRRRPSHATVVAYLALFVALSGTAIAGTGVGGIFNLGQTNTVDETSTLSGTKAGAQLQVTNNSTNAAATGLRVTTPAGVPPLAVTSAAKVVNLDSDTVDGYHASWIGGRAAQGRAENTAVGSPAPVITLATAELIVPIGGGFVKLDSSVEMWDGIGDVSCPTAYCTASLRLHDVSANVDAPVYVLDLNDGDDWTGGSPTFIFPATKGIHKYTLTAQLDKPDNVGVQFVNPVLTAQFVPFGYGGGGSGLAPGAQAAAAAKQAKAARAQRRARTREGKRGPVVVRP